MVSSRPLPPGGKRKDPPSSSKQQSSSKKQKVNNNNHNNVRNVRNARVLSTQTSSDALQNGSLDVNQFVSAREYEILALEQGMQRSKKALNRRAFQQVPRDLRRRTAAHDVKRVPKRLRGRAQRELVEDNTPTRKKKITRHMRLRMETVKKLRALGAKRKRERDEEAVKVVEKIGISDGDIEMKASKNTESAAVKSRKPKIKATPTLAKPPVPKPRFRKRQKYKSWLPTHLYHAKRAHMTSPSGPLWKFAIPLTPTQKSYRPTHRASKDRGVIAWDVSYISTISLEGQEGSLVGLLKGLGVGVGAQGGDPTASGGKGEKWRCGRRVLDTFVFEREEPRRMIAPVTLIWCPSDSDYLEVEETCRRQLFLRVHPSAFMQLWEEVVRLSKVVKPTVAVEDLRFDIGSIQVAGPGSTEAFLGTLWPTQAALANEAASNGKQNMGAARTWTSLVGITNTASLPTSAVLAFEVQDPRLHHPPRTVEPGAQDQGQLVQLLAHWPPDSETRPASLFDRVARSKGAKLPSQKAVSRRRTLAAPGAYVESISSDPSIPIVLHTPTDPKSPLQWTLLAPWKTIDAIWRTLMYYPLSTGGQPRLGGLREQQQLHFETGKPWFPGDFPGTLAGWEWEVLERRSRWEEWHRRPRSKRTAWEKVDVGGVKGELGEGWSCDWTMLTASEGLELATEHGKQDASTSADVMDVDTPQVQAGAAEAETEALESKTNNDLQQQQGPENTATRDVTSKPQSAQGNKAQGPDPNPPTKPANLTQLTATQALTILKQPSAVEPGSLIGKLMTVRVHLLTRGVPQACARIYSLPSVAANKPLRDAWLARQPSANNNKSRKSHARDHKLGSDVPPHVAQRKLAKELLSGPPQAGSDAYPVCPSAEHLIGFVTTGNFNLAEGMGTGVGSLAIAKLVDAGIVQGPDARLCVVRNAGEDVGRLGRWEPI